MPTFVPLAEYVDRVVAAARKSVTQKKARAPESETRAEVTREETTRGRCGPNPSSTAGLPQSLDDATEAPNRAAGEAVVSLGVETPPALRAGEGRLPARISEKVAGDAPGGTPAPPAVTAPGGGLARPTGFMTPPDEMA